MGRTGVGRREVERREKEEARRGKEGRGWGEGERVGVGETVPCHRDHPHQLDFGFSGAGLYSRCISRRRISKAMPINAKVWISVSHTQHLTQKAKLLRNVYLPTFLLSFALDSTNAAPSFFAIASPSAKVTRLVINQ